MKNITISMDEELARKTRVEAAKAGKSMSRFIAELLEERFEPEQKPGSEEHNPQLEAIKRFLAGPPLHIAVDGKMPTAEERNER
ncbi:ribbon-helix-helix protein, CopG family [Mesorhizobium sp. RMAD-H1]|uniref:ribbon-helix-helix protein, CopG family n=1 Tax=Mesorhizobium sp. RMAD-H1 TaxID=2587065 RepID=UPI00162001CC|nr:ribbon-helix-helix protein, CopG family [Mesorhizobium sp. RMAD-H1]MBB2971235.1 plasmid stability protein [Mesorhizobium sp. RMAD-H1]